MASIYLMRHGQASFGSENYDQLSDTGYAQACFNGEFLARQEVLPDRIISGSLQRQRQTVEGLLQGIRQSGVDELPLWQENPAWNEFNHSEVLDVHGLEAGALREQIVGQPDQERYFQEYFVAAMKRWVGGAQADDYNESFADFEQRIAEAGTELFGSLKLGERVLVVTSGGPISLVVRELLGMNVEQALRLNWRLVNGGITKVSVSNRHGAQLISLNEHMHFNGPKRTLLSAR